MIKEDLKNEFIIGQTQRIILLVSSLFLAVALFFARGGLNLDSPLDSLARSSLPPQQALLNGKPTVFEFYADWCEVCKEMAPYILSIENKMHGKIDVVLLNVDNPIWLDLIEENKVKGIPQFNFFNEFGEPVGNAIGLRSDDEISKLFNSLLEEKESIDFSLPVNNTSIIRPNIDNKSISPRSHN